MAWYVALEGAEGCGKSTQAARLAASIGAVLTRETGGTAVGERLRAILHDNDVTDLADRAEALIAAADRAQHLARVVRPALDAGRHVVSDRSVFSTLAYQGYGRQLDVDDLQRINDWAVEGLWPTHVVLLDAPTDVLAARLHGRDLDRFERAGDAFHERVVAGYRTMAASDPQRWRVVDASGDPDACGSPSARRTGRRAVTSVWDHVVGQPGAVTRLRASVTTPVHAYLFVGPPGSTKVEAARAFAALLLTGVDDPELTIRSARAARRAPRRPRDPAHRTGDLGGTGARHHPCHGARSGRGRPQGRRAPRLPPPDSRRSGAPPEEHRRAATVDDVHRPRRPRARRPRHDRLSLRAHRLRRDPREPARRAVDRRGRRRRRTPRRRPRLPAATSTERASWQPTRRWPSAGGRSPSSPDASTGPARP